VKLRKFEEDIRTLATLPEADAPLISCYLEVRGGQILASAEAEARLQLLRKCVPPRWARDFDEARERIQAFLYAGISTGSRGAAVFARGGERPFFLALQFEVPLPLWIAVGATPNIYHLVELKDNYDRYVILLMTEDSARIIGVNLGSVTADLWKTRPELRPRVGREWSKDHFQDHRRERTKQFIHDQVRRLESLLSQGSYGHLILAGNPRITAAVRKALPKRISDQLIDLVPASRTDTVSDIVAATLETFLEHEEIDSQAVAERLITQLRTSGLAVAGGKASLGAVRSGQADVLVIVQGCDFGEAWECPDCGAAEFHLPAPDMCPKCRNGLIREFDVREELARLAEQRNVAIEVVERSDALVSVGGVGCLLRYSGLANYMSSAA
jgi:protein required for attachment to host cells